MRRGLCLAVPGFLVSLGVAGAVRANLTITPTFDSTISSSSYAGTIEGDINNALTFYNNTFTNPITVNIYFQTSTSGLGQSNTVQYTTRYTTWTAAQATNSAAHPNNTDEATAIANLSSGNQPTNIQETSAGLRALGFNTPSLLNSGGTIGSGSGFVYDGIITLNRNLLSGWSNSGGSYNPNRVIQHEVDEVLGAGGAGSQLNNSSNNTSTTTIGPMDLFRYSASGTPSYTTSGTATSYFSIDGGKTNIVNFNQNPTQPNNVGDYGDWASSIGTYTSTNNYVQDAYTSAAQGAASVSLSSPEGIALQAIGYDTPVPEASTLALFGVALVGLVLLPRKRRESAPAERLDGD